MRTTTQQHTLAHLRTLCFLVAALCFSCTSSGKEETSGAPENQPSWTVTVKGKVGFPEKGGTIQIQEIKNNGDGWQDTIMLSNNSTFAKKVKLTEPGYYRINFYNKQVVNIILDRADIEVNVDGNNQQGFTEVKGSPDIELIREVQTLIQTTNNSPAVAKLNQEFTTAAQQQDDKKMFAVQQQYFDLIKKEYDKIATLIEQKSPSLGAINLLQGNTLDKDKYLQTYLAVADKLKKQWPSYSHTRDFVAMVEKMKITAIGQPAPEISLPDTTGQVVKLSSMKGKYVLVDFWAKWCGPCRQENPNVVRVYHKYKDKGFTVFGVSLDRSKSDWVKAIQEDGLTWTHVSDLKFWQSEAARTYNINSIPFSLLLDPNGVIIDKNLRGQALENKLAEIFKGK